MKKRFLSLAAILVFTAQLLQAPPAAAASAPWVTAPTALLLDNATNRIVYSKNSHLKRAPASTTKLLTAIVALKLKNPDDYVTVPRYATTMTPSKIYLRTGERYRLRDLIHAVLINSANDAAAAVAITTAGSFENFAAHMNRTARELGAKNSNFVNPSGLPDSRQYSTVYDMALIMREAQRYPLLVQSLKTKTMVIRSSKGRRIYLKNHNKMLWRDRREVLGKTGWTRAARHCFVGQINVNGKKVFLAVLGSRKLWPDVKSLVDSQFPITWLSNVYRNKKLAAREKNKSIQQALKNAGFYKGKVDGLVGKGTRAAVRKFQKAHKLKADGVVGSRTWATLKPYL